MQIQIPSLRAMLPALLPIVLSSAVSYPESTACNGPATIQARVPPTFGTPSPSWRSTPADFFTGKFFITYTTNAAYLSLRNLEFTPSLLHAATGQLNDLSSFQLPGNDTVFTSYGIDTPDAIAADVYDYAGTGVLEGAQDQWEVLAWGCDAGGVQWYVSYATLVELTNTPAGIDLLSRSDDGPDDATVSAIVDALIALENGEITDLVEDFEQTAQDGARDGERPVVCDDACMNNTDLVGIF